MFRLTFKKKLTLLTTLLIAVSVACICFYIDHAQKVRSIQREVVFQSSVSELLYSTLSSNYTNSLNQQILKVHETRTSLEDMYEVIYGYQKAMEEKHYSHDKIIENLALYSKSTANANINLILLDRRTNTFVADAEGMRLLECEGKLKRTLKTTMLHTKLQSDFYYTLRLNDFYYLARLNQDTGNDIIFCLITNVTKLSAQYSEDNVDVYSILEDNIKKLRDHWSGVAGVFHIHGNDNSLNQKVKRNIVIKSDNLDKSIIDEIDDEVLEKAKTNGPFVGQIDNDKLGVLYAQISYFKPLDWYVITAQTKSELLAPGRNVTNVIIAFGAFITILSLLISLFSLNKLTKSLEKLASKANAIGKCDLTNPQELIDITKDIKNTKGDDEIAKLSGALITMGTSIQDNLNKLIKVSAKQNRIEGELKAASKIQLGMLPTQDLLPNNEKVEVSAFLTAAKEVGGDLYDAFMIDEDNLVFVIGDVSDKGVPAALFMSTCSTLVRQCMLNNMTPCKAMASINQVLSERNPNLMFITLLIGILNLKTGHYVISNAGHCQPYIIDDLKLTMLEEICGPAVGVMGDIEYSEYEGTLDKGQTIYLYTDGISEAQNENKQFYELSSIEKCILKGNNLRAQDLLNKVYANVLDFRGQALQSDDITQMAIKRL